jgi:hypothetical protein
LGKVCIAEESRSNPECALFFVGANPYLCAHEI